MMRKYAHFSGNAEKGVVFAVFRKLFAILAAVLLCAFSVEITAFCADGQPIITMADMDVEYSPSGFVPSASAGDYQSRVRYAVVDSTTGEQIDIPVKRVGRFTVHAYIEQGQSNYLASCTATLNVRKAQIYVEVINPIVAHTAMENPVSFTVGPDWASELADIKVEYKSINDTSDVGTPCGVPKDPGLYLAYFYGEVDNEFAEFPGKYLIYEIAERNGSAVSTDEARLSVPSFIRANVRSATVPYSGNATVPEFDINTACVEARLMYGKAYANGNVGVFTEEVPTEPGDYVVNCCVLDTVVGSGRLVIEKIVPDIMLKDVVTVYTPEGHGTPAVIGSDADIALTFSAYEYNDGKAGESVEFPIKECGTYLITASPEDTAHYVYDVVHCLLTIRPAQPVIKGESTVYTADGKEKLAAVTVLPEFVDYAVSYYSVKDGTPSLMEAAPVAPGEYFAVVAVHGDSRVLSATAVYGMFIEEAKEAFSIASVFKYLCIAVSLTAFAVGITELVKRYRKEESL